MVAPESADPLDIGNRRWIHQERAVRAPAEDRVESGARVDGVLDDRRPLLFFPHRGRRLPVEHERVENRYVELAHRGRRLRERGPHRLPVAQPQEPRRGACAQRDAERSGVRGAPVRSASVAASPISSTSNISRARLANDADRVRVQPAHHAMGRQDRPGRGCRTRPGSSWCSRRPASRRRIAVRRASDAPEIERSLVAMMPVGDQDSRCSERALDDRDFAGVLDRAKLIFVSQVID